MKMYKGFNFDLTCRNFQYEIGKTYEEPEAKLCHSGFHACEFPFDCFKHYDPSDVFCEVDLNEVSDETDGADTKRVGKRITINKKIGLLDLIGAAKAYVLEHIKQERSVKKGIIISENENTKVEATGRNIAALAQGPYSASVLTGSAPFSIAGATGHHSLASVSGDSSCGAAITTSHSSVAIAEAPCSIGGATSCYSSALVTDYKSVAVMTGEIGVAAASGHNNAAITTGHSSSAICNGEESAAVAMGVGSCAEAMSANSVAAALGPQTRARGVIGSWLVLTEYDRNGDLINVKSLKVDGETYDDKHYYYLKDGRILSIGIA